MSKEWVAMGIVSQSWVGGVMGKLSSYNLRVVGEDPPAGLEGLWCSRTGQGGRWRADGGFFSWMGVEAGGLRYKGSAWFFCQLVYFPAFEVMSTGGPSCNMVSPFISASLCHWLWLLQPKQLCGDPQWLLRGLTKEVAEPCFIYQVWLIVITELQKWHILCQNHTSW